MAEAIENAYLLLLGQIALITSAIFSSIPKLIQSNSAGIDYYKEDIFFLIVITVISIMMILNLIIGWVALRDILKSNLEYNSKMFFIDLLIVVILFFMNNTLMFSFKGELSLQSNEIILSTISSRISIRQTSYIIAVISFLTAIFLLLCKKWNRHYYTLKEITNSKKYENRLTGIIIICILITPLGILFSSLFVLQVILFFILISVWSFINYNWLKDFTFK